MFVNWFSPETTLEVHLKLLQNSFSNRRRSLKGCNVYFCFSTLSDVLIASNVMINCRAWKVLSDERNRIAIGQGRPEIHRFEVRCFEQKLDKLSRYLKLNDRKRLSKSRYSKTFQLRFVSTKNCSWKFVQLKRNIFQIPVLWKKRINFGASKLKLPPLKVRRFCDKVGTFCPFDIFWKIHLDKNAPLP